MRISIALAFFLVFSNARLSAQEWVEGGLYAEHYQLGYRSQQQIGGILHVGFFEHFTLNWQVGIGPSNEGGFYFHAPAGLIGGMKIINEQGNHPIISSMPLFNNLGFLLCLLPEGVGYYANEGKMRIHVSVNPLGFDYWYRRDPYFEHGRMSGSVVIRCRLMSNLKWPVYLAPQIAMTYIYRLPEDGTLDRLGFRVGVTVGFSSEDKD